MTWITNYRDFCGLDIVRDVFVETGTLQGTSMAYAIQYPFTHLHTIDCDAGVVAAARLRFRDDRRVQCHYGHSPSVLAEILDPRRETTLWLDAHTTDTCPLLDELRVIYALQWDVTPLVLIDDIDQLGWRGWPTLAQVHAAIPDGLALRHRDGVLTAFDPRQ